MSEAKMATSSTSIQGAAKAAEAGKRPATAVDYLNGEAFRKQLENALPKHLNTDRFVRSAISEFRLNTELQSCSVPSVLGFYMQAAMLGLEPSSTLGQCYPVPFNNRKTGQKECQFILSYRGMASIARRSGEVLSIDAQVVYEQDGFEIEYGLDQKLVHRPCIDADPGKAIGYYVIVRFRDGGYQYKFMPLHEIEKHRKRSKATGFSPWQTDYDEMAKKTVFRSMFKWLPLSIEDMRAASTDEVIVTAEPIKIETSNNADDIIEVSFARDEHDAQEESD